MVASGLGKRECVESLLRMGKLDTMISWKSNSSSHANSKLS